MLSPPRLSGVAVSQQVVAIDELEIPQASAQAARVLELLAEADPDFNALEEALMSDPVQAGELLRYANSPLFRRAGAVTNVPTAVRLLGLKNVRSAIVMSTLNSALPVDSPVAKGILCHLVSIATLCKLIAQVCCRAKVDDMALLGLLHDVGMIVLATNFADSYQRIRARSVAESLSLDVLELEAYGLSHDDLAGRVCRAFRLPAPYQEILSCLHHHPPGLTGTESQEWGILILAHHLLPESGLPTGDVIETPTASREALTEMLALSDSDLDGIVTSAQSMQQEG
ncbi:MAG TPA: HDOD domain-containing protein [Gammaproteobacteria bacterium]|nr:HDOD domain-containing protein [Gammaproteobacteria bacterium]